MLSAEIKSSIDPIWNTFWANETTNPLTVVEHADLRWQNFCHKSPEEMHEIVRDFVFPFVKSLGSGRDSAFSRCMVDA